MNWGVFAIMTWLLLGVELGLRNALQIGTTPMAPSFLLPLGVWVALWAPPRVAAFACLLIGGLLDLTFPLPMQHQIGVTVVLGPYALGCLLMSQAVVAARGLVIKRNPIALVVLSVVGAMVAHSVVAAMLTARWLLGDPIVWEPTSQLISRAGISAYTAVSALALSVVLYPLHRLFAFTSSSPMRSFVRRDD